jgi:hypothetical protein
MSSILHMRLISSLTLSNVLPPIFLSIFISAVANSGFGFFPDACISPYCVVQTACYTTGFFLS